MSFQVRTVRFAALFVTVAAFGFSAASWSQSPAGSASANPSAQADSHFADLGFSLYDPIYFIVGNDGGTNAKFQLSFKYQFFSEGGWLNQHLKFPSHLYLSYTQTSLWDLDEDSSPFNDSSYKPRIFYSNDFITPSDTQNFGFGFELGFAHESNGKSGVDSRAINAGYLRPTLSYRLNANNRIYMAPLWYFAADINENPDIFDYRGEVELLIGYGNGYIDGTGGDRKSGLNIWATLRQGKNSDYNSVEANVALPFRWLNEHWRGWILAQYFTGYGETMLDYNKDNGSQFRLGFALSVQ